MNDDLQAKMNGLCHFMTELMNDLKNDVSRDGTFCRNQVGAALGGLQMRVGEQWGKKLLPIALPNPSIVPNGFIRLPDIEELLPVHSLTKPQSVAAKKLLAGESGGDE